MNATTPICMTLARVLALPLMAGLLAGCDYASRLPDAPSTLGYELQSAKPPSVTAPQGELVGPPLPSVKAPPQPPTLQAEFSPPTAPTLGRGLDTQTLQVSPEGIEAPRTALALPSQPDLPVPGGGAVSNGLARLSTVGEPAANVPGAYTPPPIDFSAEAGGFEAQTQAQFPEYAPIPFDAVPDSQGSESQGYEVAALPPAPSYEPPSYEPPSYQPPSSDDTVYEPLGFEASNAPLSYDTQAIAAPLTYGTDIGQQNIVATTPLMPSMAPQMSPITVLHTRLDNGAVVKVHPVVGAPGATSMALARTIASELGAQVDASALAFAPAVFDLRASASRGSSRPEAEWKLFSSTGALVGIFPESQSNGTWETMGDEAMQAMARRVADRLRRNADLRRATLTSLASAPPITSIDYSAVLPSGAPSLAPIPRPRPLAGMVQQQQVVALQPVGLQPAPLQPVLSQPAPVQFTQPVQPSQPAQYVVNTQPLISNDPMANAIPRRRPEGVRMAALQPTPQRPIAMAPPPLQPVAPAPVISQMPPQPPIAQLTAPAPAAIPAAPSFDTLRATPDGPRALVFRGVRGAPGNGDQALGREVSRLLGQSGAQLAPTGTPNALYLTADVSRTRNGGSDTIKILWHVEEENGTRVGQVVQENDVPAGALDANWGEDAFYAAQGARDGIMELLRTSGAIDA